MCCVIVLLVVFASGLVGPGWARQSNDLFVETNDAGSEAASRIFDALTQEAIQQKATIFVISRLGAKEHHRYAYRRLHNALYRLTDYYGESPRAKVVGAIGERTHGAGLVEVYVGGTPRYRVTCRPNRDFIVDCCWLPGEPPPRGYYPYYRGAPGYKFP